MRRSIWVFGAVFLLPVFTCGAVPVLFTDANLEAAVRAQWQAATGQTLSTPPENTELADSRFTELKIRHANIASLTGLEACASLTKLDLAWNAIDDLTPIAGLTALKYLDLGCGNLLEESGNNASTPGTNQIADLTPLSGLVLLEYLNLMGNEGIMGISAIDSMEHLQQLWLGFSPIADWSPLASVADTLTAFCTSSCGFSNAELPYVAAMSHLFAFGLINETGVSDISSLTDISPSIFSGEGTSISNIAVIANWHNLNAIMLSNTGVTDLSPLAGLPELREIELNNGQLNDISALAGLTSITRLRLRDDQITDIDSLATLTGLTQLELQNNQIVDIQALIDNPGLGGTDQVNITNNPLSADAACNQLPALRAKFSNEYCVQSNAVCGIPVTLTINLVGTGTVWPEPGSHSYNQGTQLNLSARPINASGYAFSHWEGDLPEFTNPVSSNIWMEMTGDKTITAVFESPGDFTLTMIIAGPGAANGGTDPPAGVFSCFANRQEYLCAWANNGGYFAGWSGDATGYLNTPITMDRNKTVTATFLTSGHVLRVNCQGNGGIDGLQTGQDVRLAAGAAMDLWASGWNGYFFDHWEGDIPSGVNADDNPLPVTMDRSRTLSVVFSTSSPTSRTLTINVQGGNGIIEPPAGTYAYPINQVVSVSAMGLENSAFLRWEGDIDPADANQPQVQLRMDQNRSVTAVLGSADYTLLVYKTGNGNTRPEPGTYGFRNGAQVDVYSDLIDGGDAFLRWVGDVPASQNAANPQLTISMIRNRSLSAQFLPGDWHLTLERAGTECGNLFPAPGVYAYMDGRTASLRTELGDGCYFGGWTGGAIGWEPEISVVMDSDKKVAANYAAEGHLLTLAVYGQGSVAPLPGAYPLVDGIATQMRVTGAADGWRFDHWSGDLPAGANHESQTLEAVIDQDRAITANFVQYDTRLFIQIQGQGSTNPGAGLHWFDKGDSTVLTAVPGDGYFFFGWDGTLESEGDPSAREITITLNDNRLLTAIFLPETLPAPDLTNMTPQQAGNALLAAGLILGETTEDYSASVTAGSVTAQNPAPGVQTPYGGAVDIVISLGPPPDEGEGGGEAPAEGEGAGEAQIEAEAGGDGEGHAEAETTGDGEGEGGGDGEGLPLGPHSADQNADGHISLTELLRVIQFFNSGGYYCAVPPLVTEDGYMPGGGTAHACPPHATDYNPRDWRITLTELLRLIQLFNLGAYHACPEMNTEDGYCLGSAPE